jgi:hypothetical protein
VGGKASLAVIPAQAESILGYHHPLQRFTVIPGAGGNSYTFDFLLPCFNRHSRAGGNP